MIIDLNKGGTMIKLLSSLTILLFSLHSLGGPTTEQPDRNSSLYNVEQNVGLKGYDPVAYFKEYGAQALAGDSNIQGTYGDVTYYFASEENKVAFFENPTRFEPTYGGWCAWAMANQAYVDINPMVFTQHGNRMHFFISQGAKVRFDRDLLNREADADMFWLSESGEQPRL